MVGVAGGGTRYCSKSQILIEWEREHTGVTIQAIPAGEPASVLSRQMRCYQHTHVRLRWPLLKNIRIGAVPVLLADPFKKIDKIVLMRRDWHRPSQRLQSQPQTTASGGISQEARFGRNIRPAWAGQSREKSRDCRQSCRHTKPQSEQHFRGAHAVGLCFCRKRKNLGELLWEKEGGRVGCGQRILGWCAFQGI